jgi:hypothetical protein
MESTGVELRNLRARAALAAACRDPDERIRKRLLRVAASDANFLLHSAVASATPFSLLISGGVALAGGRREESLRMFDAAAARFERVDMALYREAARYTAGLVRGGDTGRSACGDSRRWIATQAVVRPEAILEVVSPFSYKAPAA